MDTHLIFDAAYAVITFAGLVVGLMIRNAILQVGGRIDVHIAEDRLIHRELERRVQHLEQQA